MSHRYKSNTNLSHKTKTEPEMYIQEGHLHGVHSQRGQGG